MLPFTALASRLEPTAAAWCLSGCRLVYLRSQIGPALSCFAVFDGHGGDHCARWASRELPRRCRALASAAGGLPADVRRPLAELLLEMDVELRSHGRLSWHCGATAVVLLVTAESLCLANLGDSRAVLCRGSRAVALSRDHKPNEPDERHRIEQAGGGVAGGLG